MITSFFRSRGAKPVVFSLCLLPLLFLIWRAYAGDLGANPVETITVVTGDWTLRFLLLTLALSPLMQWFRWPVLIRFRRMLGLYVFFYACCHFSIWLIADHEFDLSTVWEDIVERPYITLGFSALVLLLPLALTSNQMMIRYLGKSWKKLQRLTYAIVVLGVLHFLWLVKADYLEPGIYAAIAALLILQRLNIRRLIPERWNEPRLATQSRKPERPVTDQ